MDIFTIQMAKRRIVDKHQAVLLDTTVKTSNGLFAPSWNMVLQHKDGTMTDEEYTSLYRKRMIQSWMERCGEWLEVLHSPHRLALACYCQPGVFCHRYLLKNIFEELCSKLDIPFHYYGELQ